MNKNYKLLHFAFLFVFLSGFLSGFSLWGGHIERPSHYPLITGDTFRFIAQHHLDETNQLLDPQQIREGDCVFVSHPYLLRFFTQICPQIAAHFVLISSNGTGTIDERYRPYLDTPWLVAWFGCHATLQHPKIHPLPLGFYRFNTPFAVQARQLLQKKLSEIDSSLFFQEKPIHTYLNVNTATHPYRKQVIRWFQNRPFCVIQKNKPFLSYFEDLSRSRFVISPRGVNLDCYRTWEALLAGSIPVVEALGIESMFEDLPVIVVKSFEDVTQELLDSKFEKMKQKSFNLNKLHADFWLEMIISFQNAYPIPPPKTKPPI